MIILNTYNDFIQKCNNYCEIIEKRDEFDLTDFLSKVLVSLVELYHSGLFLKQIGDAEDIDKKEITHEDWTLLFSSLKNKLGNKDYYACAYDPTNLEDKEITISSLADDLADIYRDYKSSIDLFNKSGDEGKRAAMWDLQFNFIYHSSGHICDAIRAIHYFEIDSKETR